MSFAIPIEEYEEIEEYHRNKKAKMVGLIKKYGHIDYDPAGYLWHIDESVEYNLIADIITYRDRMTCRMCDEYHYWRNELCVHHIIRREDGGGNHPLNLVTLCWPCHTAVHLAMGHFKSPIKIKAIVCSGCNHKTLTWREDEDTDPKKKWKRKTPRYCGECGKHIEE